MAMTKFIWNNICRCNLLLHCRVRCPPIAHPMIERLPSLPAAGAASFQIWPSKNRMETIDRVMKAYLSTRKLSDAQRELVYADLSKFIHDLRSGKMILIERHEAVEREEP